MNHFEGGNGMKTKQTARLVAMIAGASLSLILNVLTLIFYTI